MAPKTKKQLIASTRQQAKDLVNVRELLRIPQLFTLKAVGGRLLRIYT